jgi:hypothetical protein
MSDITLDGPGGSEITIANGDRITKCDGPGNWIVWSENDGQELIILDKKDGVGSLELHGFGSITIQNKKDGPGSLIVDADCGSFSVREINGPGQTYLRNSGSKSVGTKDGNGNIYFTGRPPFLGSTNGNGRVIRESAGFAGAGAPAGLLMGEGAILFDQTWAFKVLWMPASIELRLTPSGEGLLFRIVATVGGNAVPIDLPVNGDQSVDIPVYLGNVSVGVSGWSLTASQIGFDLALRYVPPFPFMPQIPIVNQRIVLSRPSSAAGLAAPANLSPADLLALVQLQGLAAPVGVSPRLPLTGADSPTGVQLVASGTQSPPNGASSHHDAFPSVAP